MVRLPEIFHWMSEDDRWRYKFLPRRRDQPEGLAVRSTQSGAPVPFRPPGVEPEAGPAIES